MKIVLCAPLLLGSVLGQDPQPASQPLPLPVQNQDASFQDEIGELKKQVKASMKELEGIDILSSNQDLNHMKVQIRQSINDSMKDLMASSIRSGVLGGIQGGLSEMAFQIQNSAKADIEKSLNSERNYDRGTRALDRRKWDDAISFFAPVIDQGKAKADAALYWKAYALAKLGRTADATASLDTLSQKYPQSRWLTDAKVLKAEVQRAAGKPLSPEEQDDEDLKLIAINSLMQSDPERALPLLEKLMETRSSPRLRERVLFVLSQSSLPKAQEIVTKVAKGSANPDLQLKAVRNLGIYGGKKNSQLLADIYTQTNEVSIRREILNSLMVAGEKDRLMSLAKTETNPQLSGMAIHLLGAMGAKQELMSLYKPELPTKVKEDLIHAVFAQGDTKQLIEIARKEKDPALRKSMIRLLSQRASKDKEATDFLVEFLNQ